MSDTFYAPNPSDQPSQDARVDDLVDRQPRPLTYRQDDLVDRLPRPPGMYQRVTLPYRLPSSQNYMRLIRPPGTPPPNTTVDGRPLQPPQQQQPEQPYEPYISSRADRPYHQWGSDDWALQGARNYPGVAPGPYMPQARDLAGLIHGAVMGLGRFGSRYTGMPAIAMGTYASAYWKAYQAGMHQRAGSAYQQYRMARQMTIDRGKEEMAEYARIYARYHQDGKVTDPVAFQQALLDAARRYQNHNIINTIEAGDLAGAERILQVTDSHIANLIKAAHQEERAKVRAEIDKERLKRLQKGEPDIPPDYQDPEDAEEKDGTEPDTPGDDTADPDRADREGDGGDESADANLGAVEYAAQRNKTAASAPTTSGQAPTTTGQAPRPAGPPGRSDQPGPTEQAQLPPTARPAQTRPPGPAAQPPAQAAQPPDSFGSRFTGQPDQPEPPAEAPPESPPAPATPPTTTGAPAGTPPGAPPAPPTGAPPSTITPPRNKPIGLPPQHYIPPGMTPQQLDFDARRYYETGKDIYPAKNIAENTAVHRRATQIDTFINRLMDNYHPGVDSEETLLENLKRADPNLASALKDILAGGEPMPRSGSGASQYNRLLAQLPPRIRPGFSGQIYQTKQAISNNYSNGNTSRVTQAENRIGQAALEVIRSARVLPQDKTRFENMINAYVSGKVIGDPEYTTFFANWRTYVSELVKIQRGGQGAEADIKAQVDNIPPPSTTRQIYSVLISDTRSIIPSLDDNKQHWDSLNMGMPMPFYNQTARDTLDAIGYRFDSKTGNFFGAEPGGMRGQFIRADTVTGKRWLYIGNGDPNTDSDKTHWMPEATRTPETQLGQ